jgi:hypothetical protein
MAPVKGPVDLVAVVTAFDDELLAIVMVRGAVPTIVSVHPQFSAGPSSYVFLMTTLSALAGAKKAADESGDSKS